MTTAIERRRILVRGIVQGVGFRPFVFLAAQKHELSGFVGNNADGVFIEIEGQPGRIADFIDQLRHSPPPLARVDRVVVENIGTRGGTGFTIAASEAASAGRNTLVSPDSAVCDDCRAELFTPGDRRFRYPFINCTNCGPRFTITRDVPYDRVNTTMDVFPLCPDCAAEYHDPGDRRFHAQPNACPVCGPRLEFHRLDRAGWTAGTGDDPLDEAVRLLRSGGIVAVKGIGGFHLCCDATEDDPVSELRRRKNREAKPLAIMVASLEAARRLCEISAAEASLLTSPQRPIVLLRARPEAPVSGAVAPDGNTLGVMLPYTPIHHLLMARHQDAVGAGRTAVLVMTSANAADDPILYRDEEAGRLLPGIADALVTHNRVIHMRCDDSLVRHTGDGIQFLRRARGYAPAPVRLPVPAPASLLACGANNKSTFCLVKGGEAFVSQHIGRLSSAQTRSSFAETVEHYRRLFDVAPKAVAHDFHPRYQTTTYALESDVPLKIGVQHHEAHIASVLAEHGLAGPVIGVAADGTGYGLDGTVWGGEFLIGGLTGFRRFAHLQTVPLPGGSRAIRHPWVLAYVYLLEAFGTGFRDLPIPFVTDLGRERPAALDRLLASGSGTLRTSSMGRLFDAVSALLGLNDRSLYEGQAAMKLESAAAEYELSLARPRNLQPYACDVPLAGGAIPVSQIVRAVVTDLLAGRSSAEIAFRFHLSVADVIARCCEAARSGIGIGDVALSGGVFQNLVLLELARDALLARGFTVLTNHLVPPNDGGISLGQAAIAAARLDSVVTREAVEAGVRS